MLATQKIIFMDEVNDYGLCPVCSDIVKPGQSKCMNCGQLIDWSDYYDNKEREDVLSNE